MTVTRRAALFGGLAAVLTACSSRLYSGPERTVTIAAGEEGGFYLAFARLLADELNKAEPLLHASAKETEASVANVYMIRDGVADLGLVLGDVADAARAGITPFSKPIPLLALGRVYENYLQLVVRADSSLYNPMDLAGKVVSLGAAGSGAAQAGERLLIEARLKADVRHMQLADAIAALRAKRIDALLWSGGVPTPALSALDKEVPIRLLPLHELLPALRATYGPVYEEVRVPGNTYQAVRELPTIGVANRLVTSPALPDDVAAAVVRVLVNRAADLVPAQAVGAQFLDVRTLIGTGSVPLHPGAASAYRDLHG